MSTPNQLTQLIEAIPLWDCDENNSSQLLSKIKLSIALNRLHDANHHRKIIRVALRLKELYLQVESGAFTQDEYWSKIDIIGDAITISLKRLPVDEREAQK